MPLEFPDGQPAAERSKSSFPVTRWTLVGRAGAEAADGSRPALASLLERYLPALRSHLVARRKMRAEEADDLLQGFVAAKVLEQNLLIRADAARGKFRSFLLTALNRYTIDEHRRMAAARRAGPLAEMMDIPAASPEPDRAFDVAWARQVLDEAIRRTHEECERSGRADLWGMLESRVLLPAFEGVPPLEYEALVSRYALRSPAQASNVMVTAKRMFVRHLRATVGEYVDSADEIDAEVRDLWLAVRGSAPSPSVSQE